MCCVGGKRVGVAITPRDHRGLAFAFNGVADLAGPDLVSSNETRYVKLGSGRGRVRPR